MKLFLRLGFVCVILFSVAGCSYMSTRNNVMMTTPLAPSKEDQDMLMRLSYMLNQKSLTDDEQIALFYERLMLYRRFGLGTLAQQDLSRIFRLRVDIPEAYNTLGVYFIEQKSFDSAIQAFDAALELQPDFDLAKLNRGLLLYYLDRPQVAFDDIDEYYRIEKDDPYRVLWRYLVLDKINSYQAKKELLQSYNAYEAADPSWVWSLIGVFLGKNDIKHVMEKIKAQSNDHQQLARALCEADYYLGIYFLSQGDKVQSQEYFNLALATNVYDFVEHLYAWLELTKLHQ